MSSEYLNSMANYDEHTIEQLTLSVSEKFDMGLSENEEVHFAEWNHNKNYIAVGGAQGLMRVVALGKDAPATLVANHTLGEQKSTLMCAKWNEKKRTLTTCDTSGLIVVWDNYAENWFELMKTRVESEIIGICWNNEGAKIAIAYADGRLSVSDWDGSSFWKKELEVQLTVCEWAADGESLVFGTSDGKLLVYKSGATLNIGNLWWEQAERAADAKPQKEPVVCIQCWSPTPKSEVVRKVFPRDHELEDEEDQSNYVLVELLEEQPVQPIPPERPRFVVAYEGGRLVISSSVTESDFAYFRIPDFEITGARWSPNGAFIAVFGQKKKKKEEEDGLEQGAVLFLTAYGQRIGCFESSECSKITGICWDPTGLRMTIVADGILRIANIRPRFKSGGMGQVIVYVFLKEELHHYGVTFYDHRREEKSTKVVTNFEQLACSREHCVVVSKQDEENTYLCQLCNNTGTTLDYKTTTVPPKFACVNRVSAVIASADRYFIWNFVSGKSGEYSLEEQQRPIECGTKGLNGGHKDEIDKVTIGDTFFLIALKDGGICQVSLADGAITKRFQEEPMVGSMKLNCKNNRLAVVVPLEKLGYEIMFYELGEDGDWKKAYGIKREVRVTDFDFQWDAFGENRLAFKEEDRLFVCDGGSVVEQLMIDGNILAIENMVVTTVKFEKILMTPETPPKSAVQHFLVRA